MGETRMLIGLMSGTSCDGVDAALIRLAGNGLEMRPTYLDHCSLPYADRLRSEILRVTALSATLIHTEDIARLNMEIGYVFADCAKAVMDKHRLEPAEVAAIGSHGQTICHTPNASDPRQRATLQIGEPAVIAAETGVTVVADFRPADVALGGQGAPLVPWTDYVLFHTDTATRCVQNIGGIANVTHLPAGEGLDSVTAFDTGPGCMAMDALAGRLWPDLSWHCDWDGQLAAAGRPDERIVDEIMEGSFFATPPPKSAGREQFGHGFTELVLERMRRVQLTPHDQMATVTLLTARSIADAYRRWLDIPTGPVELIACGGGAKNPTLMGMLRNELPDMSFRPVEEFGIPSKAKECVSFAMLAAACLDGIPANLPRVTGASRPGILGKIVRV